ncbi:MAG: FAD-binding oxidoreductase [Mesorhizobium sp.]|nr:MAG: FAD-binding oxidoreductase [Mesorhizobium sp.]
MELSGWGRYPRHSSNVVSPGSPRELAMLQRHIPTYVARGNGRSYGDAGIGAGVTLDMRRFDRMKGFDETSGLLTVEAGVLLADLIDRFLPRGFFPAVVPGTRFVTIGGMIAADVHGKNHHWVGGFGDHVEALKLMFPSGQTVRCSRDENSDLFKATIGGMGLTGTIVEATIRLIKVETGWMGQNTVRAENILSAVQLLTANEGASYAVAWVDCLSKGNALGRSLVYLGEHVSLDALQERKPGAPIYPNTRGRGIAVPLDAPGFLLNRHSIRAFNALRYARARTKDELVTWQSYFFPLDGLDQWNRLYGRRGFLQYQFVLPHQTASRVLPEIMGEIATSGNPSFLAVLKTLGKGGGQLSFPMPGVTLALDFPISDSIFSLLDRLDRLVVEGGGRLYLAKDARQRPETFEAGYPNLSIFRQQRRAIGAEGRLASMLSKRIAV